MLVNFFKEIFKMNNKIKTKINRNTFMINGESEEDNKKREIIKNILINEENKNKSDLHNYFLNNKEEAIYKHLPYFDIYERHFSKYRGKDINLLEIGVGYGGSLKMWKNYFSKLNPNAKVNIYGIDKKEKDYEWYDKKYKYLRKNTNRRYLYVQTSLQMLLSALREYVRHRQLICLILEFYFLIFLKILYRIESL